METRVGSVGLVGFISEQYDNWHIQNVVALLGDANHFLQTCLPEVSHESI